VFAFWIARRARLQEIFKIMTNKYKDLFGKEIKVGDYITYAANDGRCGVLRVGQVTELTHSKENYSGKVIPKIRAKSARYGLSYKTDVYGWERQKDISLGFFDRLVVIPNPPEKVVKILKD